MNDKVVRDINNKDVDRYFRIWTLLARARDAIRKAREITLRKFNITPEQFLILVLIKDIQSTGDKPTPTEIARRTFRNSNTIAINVSRMVNRGLIQKVSNVDNKRAIILSLTSEGEGIYEEVKSKEVTTRIMSRLSIEQEQQLILCLNTIIAGAVHEIGQREYEKLLDSLTNV